MTIETKFNKGDAVKYWDSSSGWLYGNIQKIVITADCNYRNILHSRYRICGGFFRRV